MTIIFLGSSFVNKESRGMKNKVKRETAISLHFRLGFLHEATTKTNEAQKRKVRTLGLVTSYQDHEMEEE